MDLECPDCGQESSSYHGLSIHYGNQHEGNLLVAIHGADKLKKMYSTMSENAIAEDLGISRTAVKGALRSIDVDRRGQSEAEKLKNEQMSEEERLKQVEAAHKARRVERAEYRLSQRGYEYWRSFNGESEDTVKVHRLAAVAWYGLDAVVDNHVHHENRIPWDNRESNLAPMDPAEHNELHADDHRDAATGRFS